MWLDEGEAELGPSFNEGDGSIHPGIGSAYQNMFQSGEINLDGV